MNSLDLVYNTFSNLEKSYARSKKTRAEYLTEKFGGDIEVGSFLILQALSQEAPTSPEDIEKLSFIRDYFGRVSEYKNKLDKIRTFDFSKDAESFQKALECLDAAESTGSGVSYVEQDTLWTSARLPAFHRVTVRGSKCVCFETAPYVRVHSHAIQAMLNVMAPASVALGDVSGKIVERKSGDRVVVVESPSFWVKRSVSGKS